MRNAILSFGAIGGALLTVALLAGALVDEVGPPQAVSVELARTKERPDLGSGLCRVTTRFAVDFTNPEEAAALGLEINASGERVSLVSCAAVAALLNHASACVLSESFPAGWAEPGLGNRPDCASVPPPDGGAP